MENKLSSVAKAFPPSPIQELSFLAQRCNAINLAEGFPDFAAPSHLKEAAISAISSDFNQYRHVQGLCDYLARKMKETHSLDVDPRTDIVITCGQTAALMAAVFALIDRGDEIVLFDPSYETYEGCIRMAGGIPVYVALDPPYWTLDPNKFEKAFTGRTKAVILNSPNNPTGKVFTKSELEIIAGVCCSRDCLAITDEVYEHITYDKHISLASLPGMRERTIVTSSISKSFSVTGWRVGWAIASASVASAVRNVHIRMIDYAPTPFQEAALAALRSPPEYFESLKREYQSRRDYIAEILRGIGLQIQFKPQGSVFFFAELPENTLLTDVEYVKELIKQAGVVAVPGRGFFHPSLSSEGEKNYQHRYVRFAFCKSISTLAAAAQKLSQLPDSTCFRLN